jgi:hypothetical protein
MSMNQHEMPSDGMQPPQKPGMSTASKVLIVLGIVFGVACVLCCGGGIGFYFFAKSYIADAISKDPVKIAAVTEDITLIEIPDELAPTVSINMKIPFTDQPVMVIVVYADKETDSGLVLVALGNELGSQDEAQMRRSINQQLRQQGLGEQEGILIEESYQKEVEIRGQPATFTITKGKGSESGTPRIGAAGVFQGKTGSVMLILNADAEKFPEEKIVEMIELIE